MNSMWFRIKLCIETLDILKKKINEFKKNNTRCKKFRMKSQLEICRGEKGPPNEFLYFIHFFGLLTCSYVQELASQILYLILTLIPYF